jgi:predicted outer membrane repeat protein
LNNSTIKNNNADQAGGAILVTGSSLTITNTYVCTNHHRRTTLCQRLIDSTLYCYSYFFNNSAASSAGAVGVDDASTLIVRNSTFRNNSCMWSGGAICSMYLTQSLTTSLSLARSLSLSMMKQPPCMYVSLNLLRELAFGFAHQGRLFVQDSVFQGNLARSYGGAIFVGSDFTASLNNSHFQNNTAINDGGALYLDDEAVVDVHDCEFFNNTASSKYAWQSVELCTHSTD